MRHAFNKRLLYKGGIFGVLHKYFFKVLFADHVNGRGFNAFNTEQTRLPAAETFYRRNEIGRAHV